MSDLSQNESTSPTPGANDADGGPRSPALLAAARASRALAARRVQDVTPMPMAALPQSLTPAVATADAMDGGVVTPLLPPPRLSVCIMPTELVL